MNKRYSKELPTALIYQTPGFGGSNAVLDNSAPVDGSDGFSGSVDLTANTYSRMTFEFLGSGSTDDVLLRLYARNDSSWTGTEIAIDSVKISNNGSQDIYTYVINPSHGPGVFRFSLQSDGTTDTFDIEVMYTSYTLKDFDE